MGLSAHFSSLRLKSLLPRSQPKVFPITFHKSFLSHSRVTQKTPLSLRVFNLAKLSVVLGGLVGTYVYLSDTRAGVHSWLAVPILRAVTDDDPEKAHKLAVKLLGLIGQAGLIKDRAVDGEKLSFELWGKTFSNPIGMAAGFDKDGDAIDGLFDIGFGYVEIGSITPEPQPGNPEPRVFRLPSSKSIVNRYGFNSEGHLAVLTKLRHRLLNYLDTHRYLGYSTLLSFDPIQTTYADGSFTRLVFPDLSLDLSLDQELSQVCEAIRIPKSLRPGRVLAVNLGKNKSSPPDSIDDFKLGIRRFGHLADLLVINLSSPNTPGLRHLQSKHILQEVLTAVLETRDQLQATPKPPVLVKIAPDLSLCELLDIGDVAQACGVDGIIVSNTTTSRPAGSGIEAEIQEIGGLSGPPLKSLSLDVLSTLYCATEGKIPLVGCGGISSAADVLEYGKAGASLVQVYTALTYEGIGLPRRIKDDLQELLAVEGGGRGWNEIVGIDAERAESVRERIREARACPRRSEWYERSVGEIKAQVEYIDQHVKSLSRMIAEVTDPEGADVPPRVQSSPMSTGGAAVCRLASESALGEESKKTGCLLTTADGLDQGGDSPRGILNEWKTKRRSEIERGDDRRVV